jgi:hypothetical protein|uniref:Protein LURP-one-related 11 n=1 Tax=Zea mays TaxID=4577 RepID=A0A804UHT6_MAIZE
MAKIKPWPAGLSPDDDSERERGQAAASYTVWMKSLVFNGNGCTVYGADGRVAYRVDNYGCRGGREVFFMDRAGSSLVRIQRKVGAVHTHQNNKKKNKERPRSLYFLRESPSNPMSLSMLSDACRHCYACRAFACLGDGKLAGA